MKRKVVEVIENAKKPRIGPVNWEKAYEAIAQYRKSNVADVDTMGCHMQDTVDRKLYRYHILTSLQLSSQTKDPVNYEAMNCLKQLEQGLSPSTISKLDVSAINECIKKVGFHNRKAIYMKQTAEILLEKYEGDIPDTLEGLLELPGIGPKMAYICLQVAWDKVEGIGVDTHVHRISNRLGWVKTKSPEETRESLEDWLPRDKWGDVNAMLVGFGQLLCKPVKPNCDICPAYEYCKRVGVKSKK